VPEGARTGGRRLSQVSDVSDQFADGPGDVPGDLPGDVPGDVSDELAGIEQAMADARSRLLDVPAEVVVTNHVMGLYELAAIHLSAEPPNLAAASLAIDAVGCLVDGLGDRLGDDATTMRDALANIRLAYVSLAQRP
jgi:hypothetical protein